MPDARGQSASIGDRVNPLRRSKIKKAPVPAPSIEDLRPVLRRISDANRMAWGHRPDSWRRPGIAPPQQPPKFLSARSGNRGPAGGCCRKSYVLQAFGSLLCYAPQLYSAYRTPFVSSVDWLEP